MYFKSSFLTLALVSSLALAHPHGPHPHPNCTVGTDTQACALEDGSPGMFICHPHPPHGKGPHHHHHGDGIGGAILRVVDRVTGRGPPSHSDDHEHFGPMHHGEGHSHHHHHHDHDHKKGPHRQLRSGSSSSSSSSSRSGPPMGRHGGHHHGHGGRGGKHGPGFLSPTKCVPVDGPPKDHPFHKDHPHHHGHGGPPSPPTCGCCGDVCPIKLDCGCTCDLTDCHGNAVEDGKGKGVWVEVTMPWMEDNQTPLKKCVPAGSYADANRVKCVTECSAEMVEDEGPVDLMVEHFGAEEEDLEEKESRD